MTFYVIFLGAKNLPSLPECSWLSESVRSCSGHGGPCYLCKKPDSGYVTFVCFL